MLTIFNTIIGLKNWSIIRLGSPLLSNIADLVIQVHHQLTEDGEDLDLLVEELHHKGELAGVLAGAGHPHGAKPVIVHAGELMGYPLHKVHGQLHTVVHHHVMHGEHGILTDKEEVAPVPLGVGEVQHGNKGGIVQLFPRNVEDPDADPLLDNSEAKLSLLESSLNCSASHP